MDETFLKAFTEIIREQITRGREVEVGGLGVFKCEHQKQFQKKFDNGRVVMKPPRDVIVFSQEQNDRV